MYENSLSIIIICKNEERNIERCINSINRINFHVPYEILLIDSCSTDNTVTAAQKFKNVKIYKLNEKWHHNAAIGRYVGCKLAIYKYLLFIDGDMEISKDCDFAKAIKVLESNKKIIALSGSLEEYIYNEKHEVIKHIEDRYKVKDFEERVDLGGVFLIKKSLLEQVGNMDINLDAQEDLDLNYRFKFLGYKLYRMPELKFIHHTKDNNSFKVLNLRFNAKMHRDLWLVTLRSIKYRCFIKHFYANRGVFTWIASLLATMSFTVLFILNLVRLWIFVSIIIGDILLFIYKILRKKQLKIVVVDFYHAFLCLLSIFQTYNRNLKIDLSEVVVESEKML